MRYSYHVHSTWSDGRGTIEEIVSSAKREQLDEVGISDHYVLLPDHSHYGCSMRVDQLDTYLDQVNSYSTPSLPVRAGLEVDFLPSTIDRVRNEIGKREGRLDYLIGSVHLINEKSFDIADELTEALYSTEALIRYWDYIRQMAETSIFDIVGHLDLTKKFGKFPRVDLSENIERALHAIKHSDMAVELNTSGYFQPCHEQFPSMDLLKRCKDLEIPILITSDSHHPDHLVRGFDRAHSLIKEVGITETVRFHKRQRISLPMQEPLLLQV